MLPDFIKVENGHEMEVYPVYEQGGGAEEIIFWCHSCDPEGRKITSCELRQHTVADAYYLLAEYGQLHAEGPVENEQA